MNILSLFIPIKYFVLDVDGVFTDNTVLLQIDGSMLRSMHVRDGYAVALCIKKGYEVIIISGGKGEALEKRFSNLGVKHVFLGVKNKLTCLNAITKKLKCKKETILYMGDDMLDIACMKKVSLACAPKDACTEVLQIATYISSYDGGKGCVRDVIEKVLKLNNDWE